MKSRQERRQEARGNNTEFAPQYNGNSPVTFEQYYGVGYERFNSKHVTIKDIANEEAVANG